MVWVLKRSTLLPHVVADFADYWETSQSNACLLHFAAGPLLDNRVDCAVQGISKLASVVENSVAQSCRCTEMWGADNMIEPPVIYRNR